MLATWDTAVGAMLVKVCPECVVFFLLIVGLLFQLLAFWPIPCTCLFTADPKVSSAPWS